MMMMMKLTVIRGLRINIVFCASRCCSCHIMIIITITIRTNGVWVCVEIYTYHLPPRSFNGQFLSIYFFNSVFNRLRAGDKIGSRRAWVGGGRERERVIGPVIVIVWQQHNHESCQMRLGYHIIIKHSFYFLASFFAFNHSLSFKLGWKSR